MDVLERSGTYWFFLLVAVFGVLSCGRMRLEDARNHYVRGEYHEAVEAYRTLYRQASRDGDAMRGVIAFELAENYRLLNRSAHAATAYANAVRYGYPDSVAVLRLAQMLHREGDYAKAVDTYRRYLSHSPDHEIALAGLDGAEKALLAGGGVQDVLPRYRVQRVDLFNSSRSDFSPFLAHNDEVLYFTSSREAIPGEWKSTVTGTKFHDLYLSSRNSRGEWQKPKRIESALNTDDDEGTASVTADGEWMFYSLSGEDADQFALPGIYVSRRVNGIWSAGNRLKPGVGDSLSLFAHPSVSSTGVLLYFVSDMPGGVGGKDIWVASLNSRREVVRVENAGPAINTPGDEMFPMLRNDSTLYFSSNGHAGRGGLDLFCAVKQPGEQGWRLEHLPWPLNSEADDFGITFEKEGESGFFSSNRDDMRGYDHIFSFQQIETGIRVEGIVVDREDRLIPGAVVDMVGSNGVRNQFVTNREGSYGFMAEPGVRYLFLAQAEGFLNQTQSFGPLTVSADTLCYVDFEMTPYDRPVVLEHIFYDFNSAVLRDESKSDLEGLVLLMRDHPEIVVELAAHTDRKGTVAYNDSLSLRRARSVVDYLIVAGIDAERLSSVGYGKLRPKQVDGRLVGKYPFLREGEVLSGDYIQTLLPEEQEVADQLNRRTEFRVLPSPLTGHAEKE